MMFETVYSIASNLWTNYQSWHPPVLVLYIVIGLSLVSAILVTRITGSTSLITVPTSFVILYYCAKVGNFAALSVPMPEIGVLQKALIYSTLGHFVGGLMVLGIFKVAER